MEFRLGYIPKHSLIDMQKFINDNDSFFLFGADNTAVTFRRWLEKQNKVVQGFIDNDNKKIGTILDGLNVTSLNELNVKDSKIIITSIHSHEISKQLENIGLEIFCSYIPFDNYGWINIEKFVDCIGNLFYEKFQKHINEYEEVLAILSDEESKDIYSRVINYRLTALDPIIRGEKGFPLPLNEYRERAKKYNNEVTRLSSLLISKFDYDITDLLSKTLAMQPYVYKDKITNNNLNVVIDAGGFVGDTAMAFAYSSPNGKVYTFEPSSANYRKIKDLEKRFQNIISIQAGLWDEDQFVKLSEIEDQPNASFINENGEDVKVYKLDSYVEQNGIDKVDLIKMDIEGAEYNALIGAVQTIKRDYPDLAICIYHSPEDLWRIPLWIKRNFPEYNIYIDHKDGMNVWGTVCFATVRQ
ncbi:MAG TPA: FkbM family methyltransferase [Bacillus bacterium]|nr:FkbM family methyltransferase [Bacillus sp. (in: firmicutes)]